MRNGLDIYRGQPSIFRMISEFDRLFDHAVVNPWLGTEVRDKAGTTREWFEPRIDIQENEDAFFMTFDVPGIRKEDLKIDMNGRHLTISGERKRQGNGGQMYGKFSREVTLPDSVESEKIEAKLEDGVLAIAFPKAVSTKPRTIEIGMGKPSFFSKLIGTTTGEKNEE